tara:strand:- start:38 stop:151 length:114 start_codon:yes stop_codon:yes gene_type:complete
VQVLLDVMEQQVQFVEQDILLLVEVEVQKLLEQLHNH